MDTVNLELYYAFWIPISNNYDNLIQEYNLLLTFNKFYPTKLRAEYFGKITGPVDIEKRAKNTLALKKKTDSISILKRAAGRIGS